MNKVSTHLILLQFYRYKPYSVFSKQAKTEVKTLETEGWTGASYHLFVCGQLLGTGDLGAGGWRDGSKDGAFKGPKLSVPAAGLEDPLTLPLGIQHRLLASEGTCTYAQTHRYISKQSILKKKSWFHSLF